jgi:hypothetical protein
MLQERLSRREYKVLNENVPAKYRGHSRLSPDHRQEHFEPLRSLDGMGLTGRQDDGFARLHLKTLSRYANLSLPFEYLHERLERGSVFAEFLPGVERKQRDVSGFCFGDLAADDGAILVGGHPGQG